MNTEQCMKLMEALEVGCQSQEVFWECISELWALRPEARAEQPALPALKAKKAKKVKGPPAEGAVAAEPALPPKAPSAWNHLVSQTVTEMRKSGWESWTTVQGVVWPASKWALVKNKKGVESEAWVYDGGEHDGKQPSPALGGMLRASYLKTQSDPAAMAKALAYHAKLAEKRESSAATSDAEGGAKKGGRPKMTEEQKAAAKLKREAKKAEAAALAPIQGLQGGWAEE
jgi:hypothetical protein